MQQDVYTSSLEVEVKLEQLKTDFSLCMLQCFRKRFSSTADFVLSKLAYFLTPDGLIDFRSRDNKDKTQITNQLKKKFMEVASKFSTNSDPSGTFLPAILHYYLNYYQFEKGDSPFFIFENMKSEKVTIAGINGGKEIPLRILRICLSGHNISSCIRSNVRKVFRTDKSYCYRL